MKKTLSIILSFVMLFSIASTVNLTAYADTYYERENNDTFQNANTLSCNSTVCGAINGSNDKYDFYKFTLTSNSVVDISVSHENSNNEGFWTCFVYKYTGNNNLERIVDKNIYVYDGDYSFTKLGLSSGTYYIRVGTWYQAVYNTQYNISLNFQETDTWESEFNNSYYTANDLRFGKTTYGNICGDADDYDFYKFTLSKTTSINISVSHKKFNKDGFWTIAVYEYVGNNNLERIIDDDIYVSDGNYTSQNLILSSGTYFVRIGTWYQSVNGLDYGVTLNYYISTPSNFKVATRGAASLKLSWNKVANVSGYQLQKKSGDTYKTVTTTTSTSATVKDLATATNYKFRVRAYKTVNGKKYYGSWKYLTTPTKPGKVSIKTPSTNSKHQIVAKWNKVTRASGYQVQYCKNSSCSNVIATKTVSGGSKTSYTGKNFTKKKKYYVRVRAYKTVDGKKYYGAWSNVKSITCK